MGLEVNMLRDAAPQEGESMKADRRLYVNADWTKLCEEGDVDAAALLSSAGKVLSQSAIDRLGLALDADGRVCQVAPSTDDADDEGDAEPDDAEPEAAVVQEPQVKPAEPRRKKPRLPRRKKRDE